MINHDPHALYPYHPYLLNVQSRSHEFRILIRRFRFFYEPDPDTSIVRSECIEILLDPTSLEYRSGSNDCGTRRDVQFSDIVVL